MPDLLQAPLAGERPGDVRLPYPVEIPLGPCDLCHCVMRGPPLNLALWRTLSAVTVGFDCQSPPPRYVYLDFLDFPGPGTTQSRETRGSAVGSSVSPSGTSAALFHAPLLAESRAAVRPSDYIASFPRPSEPAAGSSRTRAAGVAPRGRTSGVQEEIRSVPGAPSARSECSGYSPGASDLRVRAASTSGGWPAPRGTRTRSSMCAPGGV